MQAQVLISRVTDVQAHPNNESLDVIAIAGTTNIAHRASYKVGDYAAVLPPDLILPEWLLRHLDLWDDTKKKGRLAGSNGNRTKARKVAGVVSEVELCKVGWQCQESEVVQDGYKIQRLHVWISGRGDGHHVTRVGNLKVPPFTPEGIDLGWLLIENYQEAA